jgi:Mn-containing catalase
MDGKGNFNFVPATPHGQEPKLGPPDVKGHAQKEQMGLVGQAAAGIQSVVDKVKDALE